MLYSSKKHANESEFCSREILSWKQAFPHKNTPPPMTSQLVPVQVRKPTELLRERAKQTTQKLNEFDN